MLILDSLLIEGILTPHINVCDTESTVSSLNGTLTLTSASASCQKISGSAIGFSIALPNATTLQTMHKLELFNISSQPISIKRPDGTVLFSLSQTSIATMWLENNATSNGNWIAFQTFFDVASGIVNYTITSSTPFSTGATTDTLITGFSLTPTRGTYLCLYNSDGLYTTTPRYSWCSFFCGGTLVADSTRRQITSRSNQGITQSTMAIIVFDGTQNCDIRVRCDPSGGNITINQRTMTLVRLGGV